MGGKLDCEMESKHSVDTDHETQDTELCPVSNHVKETADGQGKRNLTLMRDMSLKLFNICFHCNCIDVGTSYIQFLTKTCCCRRTAPTFTFILTFLNKQV